jgi:hypothetical protein
MAQQMLCFLFLFIAIYADYASSKNSAMADDQAFSSSLWKNRVILTPWCQRAAEARRRTCCTIVASTV